MLRSIIGVAVRWSKRPSRRVATGVAAAAAAAVGLTMVANGGIAFAGSTGTPSRARW